MTRSRLRCSPVTATLAVAMTLALRASAIPQAPAYDAALVAHWTFDEGAGPSVADSSGHGHRGTLVNGVAWTAGRKNGALTFDGVDDRVDLGRPSIPGVEFESGEFTVAFWVRTSQTTTSPRQWPEVLSKNNKGMDGIDTGFEFYWGNTSWGNRRLSFKTTSEGREASAMSSVDLNDGTWHHYVGIRRTTGVELYVDGALDAIGRPPQGSLRSAAPLRVGRMQDDWSQFAGSVDEVRIYARALSPDEVRALYRADIP